MAQTRVKPLPVGAAARSLPALVAEEMMQDIIDARLAPGTRLTEIALSEQHAVSRATVREALAQLERQRFVERLPRHGARVAELGVETFLELYEIRAVLLGLAAARAATRAAAEELGVLDRKVDELDRLARRNATSASLYSRNALEAQKLVLSMSRARWLVDIYEQLSELTLWRAVLRKRALSFSTPERRRGSAADYRRVAEAIGARDPGRAEAAARSLIDASAEFVRQQLLKTEPAPIKLADPVNCQP
jgi:DNA-binding GntR family transcriptional regulator